jgi:hypothetical protein
MDIVLCARVENPRGDGPVVANADEDDAALGI